jgi:hypothetical protein
LRQRIFEAFSDWARMWLRRSTPRRAEHRTIAGKSVAASVGRCAPPRSESAPRPMSDRAIRRQHIRNMLINSCIGANRLLLTRGRCVPRSDRTTDQWSSHRPIDIHCKRLSGRIFGTSLRRGKMPAKTRRRSCPWREVWQTPDRGVCRGARRWRTALRTDRVAATNAWCSSQKVRDLAHYHACARGR